MKGSKFALTALAFLLAFAAGSPLYAQTSQSSKSVQFAIVAVVPRILDFTLGFSPNQSAIIEGYLPGAGEQTSARGSTRFEIAEGSQVSLGSALLNSNVKGSYVISARSDNGGYLRPDAATQNPASGIPYLIYLGDTAAESDGGVYTFNESGKTTRGGKSFEIALAIAEVPAGTTGGTFSDRLVFSISAN